MLIDMHILFTNTRYHDKIIIAGKNVHSEEKHE